jgi:hypothetical protein
MDMLAPKAIGPVFSPIVYEVIPIIEVFVVGQNQPLMAAPPRCRLTHNSLSDQALGFSQGAVESMMYPGNCTGK